MKPHIVLNLAGGLKLCAPAKLACVTTYILLEQEAWFEKEAAFIARYVEAGMTAVDIGANHGVYALAMARAIGPGGAAIAYEPDADTADLLEQSKDLNGLSTPTIIRSAVSDIEGEAKLFLGKGGSETNSLTGGPAQSGPGETVAVTFLDAESRRLGWERLDMLKIDAEGEEDRVIEGARETLTRLSPLVMFEIRDGATINAAPVKRLQGLGYDLYRLVGDGEMLVPCEIDAIDPWELNLFAAKPDRAEALERRGLLAGRADTPTDIPPSAPHWVLRAPFLAEFGAQFAPVEGLYRTGLAAYEMWRNPHAPAAQRYGALMLALHSLRVAAIDKPSPSRLSTLVRIALDVGERSLALTCLADILTTGAFPSGEPFLAPSSRFDAIATQGHPREWFMIAVSEQRELLSSYSTIFQQSDMTMLTRICQSPFASAQMPRRLALQMARAGQMVPAWVAGQLVSESQLNRDLLRQDKLALLARI